MSIALRRTQAIDPGRRAAAAPVALGLSASGFFVRFRTRPVRLQPHAKTPREHSPACRSAARTSLALRHTVIRALFPGVCGEHLAAWHLPGVSERLVMHADAWRR